jgi:hypothetical protein
MATEIETAPEKVCKLLSSIGMTIFICVCLFILVLTATLPDGPCPYEDPLYKTTMKIATALCGLNIVFMGSLVCMSWYRFRRDHNFILL